MGTGAVGLLTIGIDTQGHRSQPISVVWQASKAPLKTSTEVEMVPKIEKNVLIRIHPISIWTISSRLN